MPKAQYTPPTQLNCRVELHRRCVLNSQLVGDSLDESEQFADNEVELRRVGGVNAPVVTQFPIFLRQSHIGCRIVNWVTTADGCVHTADTTQLDRINSQHVQFPNVRWQSSWASCEFNRHRRRDSTWQLSRVGGVYWVLEILLLTWLPALWVYCVDVLSVPGVSTWQQWTSALHSQTTCSGSDDISDQPILSTARHSGDLWEGSCRQGTVTFTECLTWVRVRVCWRVVGVSGHTLTVACLSHPGSHWSQFCNF